MIKWILSLSFLLLLGRLCFFTEPFGVSVDESTYMTLAEIIRSGGTPYVDAVDRKPVGLFWLYAGLGGLGGDWNIHFIHAVFFLIALLCCLMFLLFDRFQGGPDSPGWKGAILFAIFSSCFPREIISSNAEWPMLLLLTLGIYFFVKGSFYRQSWALILAGVLLAASAFMKQYSVVIFGLFWIPWLLSSKRRGDGGILRGLREAGLVLFGALGVLGAVTAYFWKANALSEFINYCFLDGMHYVAESRSIENKSTSFMLATVGMLLSWPLLWILLSKTLRKRDESNLLLWPTLGAFAGALITAYLSGRYYSHYFVPVVWFLSFLAAMSLPRLEDWKSWKWTWALAAALPFALYILLNVERDRFTKAVFSKGRQEQILQLSQWIKHETSSEDRILVWGMASQIYVASERGSASRFIFADFPSGRQPGMASSESRPTPGAMEIYLEDVQIKRPKIFVDTSSAELNDYQHFPLARFPNLEEVIKQNYEGPETVAGFQVWRRKN